MCCDTREARRGCPEGVDETRERGRKRDEKTSWMNEFGAIPAKQEGRKGKMGKEETRSAVMERGATALTIRGRAWPFWAGAGSGDQGVGDR